MSLAEDIASGSRDTLARKDMEDKMTHTIPDVGICEVRKMATNKAKQMKGH